MALTQVLIKVAIKDRMFEDIVPTDPILFIDFESSDDKISAFVADSRVYGQYFLLDVIDKLIFSFSSPRSLPMQHLIKYAPDCPNITFWGIALPL